MAKRPSLTTNPLPRWLVVVASVVIVFHLSSVALRALAAPSGPWPTMEGPNTFPPPAFALNLYQWLPEQYDKFIQMTDHYHYHFPTNRPGQIALSFDVRLKDAQGKELATVTIPDQNANFWMRHRQTLLANALSLDVPVAPPSMERIPAPHQKVEMVPVWLSDKPNHLQLKEKAVNTIEPGQPLMRPSEVTMIFLRSYVRHLCRTHGAASAQVIRYHQDPIPPDVLFQDAVPADAFAKVESNFGELTK